MPEETKPTVEDRLVSLEATVAKLEAKLFPKPAPAPLNPRPLTGPFRNYRFNRTPEEARANKAEFDRQSELAKKTKK